MTSQADSAGKTWPWPPARWRAPGREARDTYFLLGLVAATLAPHAGHLPGWCLALAALVLGWRAWLAAGNRPLPSRWTLAAVLAVAVLLNWLQFRTMLGREPGITLLVLLMGLKTLELRARRDAFVVFFLGFFLVLTHYLYSQSMLTALWTLACTWGLLTALVLAQMPLGQPHLALAARQAARVTLWGLPVMAALFLLFPRIGPLWGIPAEGIGRTGLSDQLQFGAMSEIASDPSIALRVRVLEGRADPRQWYFRAAVLSEFDGQRWRASQALLPGEATLAPEQEQALTHAPALRYEMTLEPLRIRILPVLEQDPRRAGATLHLDDVKLDLDREHVWRASQPLTSRLRFQHDARTAAALPQRLHAAELRRYLALPAGLNPRSRAFAQALRERLAAGELPASALHPTLVEALLQHLREQPFTYTLAPGRYGELGPHLIDEFWFDRRLGFCEHFASAFVVMLRAMGVPARVVTGYQGTDPDPQDGFWVVRQSQAHAWAEYWQAGQGWVRVDPTAAVAPNRVQQGLTLQAPPGLVGSMLDTVSPDLWRRLRSSWETLDNRWQQWVLGYARQEQFQLLQKLGFESPDWTALGQAAAGLMAAALGLALAWNAWQSRPHDPWTRQRLRVQRDLARLGVAVPLHGSYSQWARALEVCHGPRAGAAAELLRDWDLERYGSSGATIGRASWRRPWRQALRRMR